MTRPTEHATDEEYTRYIEALKQKPIMQMSYEELSDLTAAELEHATDLQDWPKLKQGLRLLMLTLNIVEAKAYAAKEGVKALLKES